MTISSIIFTAICTSALSGLGQQQQNHRLPNDAIPVVTVPNLDYSALFDKDQSREIAGQAPQFAVPTRLSITPATNGIWERVDINTQRWTMRVACDNALSMNLGFGRYNMPASGSMTITDASGEYRIRPFTADDNKPHGQLWTPVVPGTEAIIEIIVDSDEKAFVVKGIELTSINSGYRWVHDAAGRGSSESCNIDVMCPEGNSWWNEIPSVGVYTLNGYLTCTGVMLNNTAQDQRPYFLTANHCGVTSSSDSSIVVYWNYQNSYCRTPGSADSGGPGDGNFNQFTSGSTWRASRSYSDFTLTQLSSNPNAAWGVTYSGWSRAGSASIGAGVHHPEAAEKRISFPDTVQASGEYWDVNWGGGRTAPGSSGSPLYDGNHRVVGQLCCGSSYCPNDLNDYYGRSLNLSWDGTASSSLNSWLDPTGSNAQAIDTLVPGGGGDPSGACCVGTSCTYGTAADCAAIGGVYQGDYVSCTTYPCGGAPTGACCVGTNCSVLTQAACTTAGGTYQGDGTTCDVGICDNGGCQVGYSPDCVGTCFEDAVYTDWVGDGFCDDGAYIPADYGYGGPAGVPIFLNCAQFNCDNNDCTGCGGGDPTGACCVGTTCTVDTQAACTAAGGTYQGDNSSCTANPCATDPTGSCCFGTNCFELVEAQCTSNGGTWGGANTTCGADTCGTTTCAGDVDGSGAVDVSDVLALVSAWGTADVAADVNGDGIVDVADLLIIIDGWGPCPGGGDPTGACCVGTTCTVGTQVACTAAGGTYLGDNTTCMGSPCATDPTGACCVGTTCTVGTQIACTAAGGTYLGDNTSCTGTPCGGGGCPAGEIEDCNGNCCPESWVADGYCDDGTYSWNGVPIFLNCDQFNCDGGDCTGCGGGGDPTGACCVGTTCTVGTQIACTAAGGTYLGDNTSCTGTPCGGGGCPAGEIEDCNGNCCPESWVADGYCDDGTYSWNGVPIFLNCDQFNCDGGDCTGCGGGGDPTGACCVGTTCTVDTQVACTAAGGTYQGDNTTCTGNPCGGGGCPTGWTADCQGTCFPDYVYASWVGDGFCDDGAYIPADYGCTECPAGVAIWLNCAEFTCDGGDCTCP